MVTTPGRAAPGRAAPGRTAPGRPRPGGTETGGTERARETREAILDAAERLFAERGVGEVSNRQIVQAAGQANNFAVGYHFGTRADLVRAIVRRYTSETESRRLRMLETIGGSADLRAWISCLVRPATDHLDALGVPGRRARCLVQVITVPALRLIVTEESVTAPSMRRTLEGMLCLLPGLPEEAQRARGDMTYLLLAHTLAERERALHEDGPAAHPSWEAVASGLVDALTGLWQAPVTPVTPDRGEPCADRGTRESS